MTTKKSNKKSTKKSSTNKKSTFKDKIENAFYDDPFFYLIAIPAIALGAFVLLTDKNADKEIDRTRSKEVLKIEQDKNLKREQKEAELVRTGLVKHYEGLPFYVMRKPLPFENKDQTLCRALINLASILEFGLEGYENDVETYRLFIRDFIFDNKDFKDFKVKHILENIYDATKLSNFNKQNIKKYIRNKKYVFNLINRLFYERYGLMNCGNDIKH